MEINIIDKQMKPTFSKSEIVNKGWGKEEIFSNNDKFCGKLLCFDKGKKMSTHFHLKKSEQFLCFSGLVMFYYFDLVTADKIEKMLHPGETVYIPAGCPHQIEALVDSIIIEVSTHDDPADSYRVEKGNSQL